LPIEAFQLLAELNREALRGKEGQLVVDVLGGESLLREKNTRAKIILYLTLVQAKELLGLLSVILPEGANAWDALNKVSFAKGNKNYDILLDFFGVEKAKKDEEDETPSEQQDVVPAYPLFEHQIKATKQVNAYLDSRENKVLLHMPTGAGKTRTAMNVICDHFRNAETVKDSLVIWIANSKELCEQASDEFMRTWGYLGNRVVKLHRRFDQYGSSLQGIDSGLLIAGIDMLYSRGNSEDEDFIKLARKVKLVIFDEAHLAVAPTYKNVVETLLAVSRPGLLGLSATPGRTTFVSDTENEDLAKLFAKQKVILEIPGYADPVQYLQAEKYIAQVKYESVPYTPEDIQITPRQQNAMQGGEDVPAEVMERLGLDAKRNLLIINRIIEQMAVGKQIIVFAASVKSAIIITSILRFLGHRAAVVTANSRSKDRRDAIQKYKDGRVQVLVNYGVLTTGFDAPKTNVAIIARPTTSLVLYSQMVGRAIRGTRAGGNDESTVFTVVDDLPGFRDISQAFLNWEDAWV
jgi:superfamily II DNA or RNA helicase